MLGDPSALSFLHRFPPSRLLSYNFNNAARPLMVLQKSETEIKRFFACCMGRFINKALYSKGIVRTPDRAPETDRHRIFDLHIFDPYVGDLVFHVLKALDCSRVYALFYLLWKHT